MNILYFLSFLYIVKNIQYGVSGNSKTVRCLVLPKQLIFMNYKLEFDKDLVLNL